MEPDLAKNREILAEVMRSAELHKISLKEAATLLIKQAETRLKELEAQALDPLSDPEYSSPLKTKLGSHRWQFFMEKLKEYPTSEELLKSYQHALDDGNLKLARLREEGRFHVRNSDFIGEKFLAAGSLIEVEVLEQIKMGRVWLTPIECEYMFLDELEFI